MPTSNSEPAFERVFYWANEMFSPAITAIIIGVLVVLSFAGGFTLEHWRTGARIEALNSQNGVLSSANERCATDIQGVKQGVSVIIAQVEEREKAASEAMKQADLTVAEHKNRVKIIRALPAVAPNMQCAAMVQEQIAYVQERKNAN